MSEEARELRALVRSAHAWLEWLRDSGIDDLPSDANLSRELASIGNGGMGALPVTRPGPAPSASRSGAFSAAAPPAPEAPPEAAARPVLDAAERLRRLEVLAEEAKRCMRCQLHAGRTHSVFSRGSPSAEIVFVGEGPGQQEDLEGRPFVGAAGKLLDKMIEAMGLSAEEVYICNAVKCRPPDNRKPEPEELAACAPFLQQQLELLQPKVLVALGATGVQALLGSTTGITRIRGTWKLYKGRIPVMPTFHPAYLLRSPDKKREVWEDLKAVLARLGRQPPPPRGRSRKG